MGCTISMLERFERVTLDGSMPEYPNYCTREPPEDIVTDRYPSHSKGIRPEKNRVIGIIEQDTKAVPIEEDETPHNFWVNEELSFENLDESTSMLVSTKDYETSTALLWRVDNNVGDAEAKEFETGEATAPKTEVAQGKNSEPELCLSWENYARESAKHDGLAKCFWLNMNRETVKGKKKVLKRKKNRKVQKAKSDNTVVSEVISFEQSGKASKLKPFVSAPINKPQKIVDKSVHQFVDNQGSVLWKTVCGNEKLEGVENIDCGTRSKSELVLSWDNYERQSAKHDGKAKFFWSDLNRETVKSLKRKSKKRKKRRPQKTNSDTTLTQSKVFSKLELKEKCKLNKSESARMHNPQEDVNESKTPFHDTDGSVSRQKVCISEKFQNPQSQKAVNQDMVAPEDDITHCNGQGPEIAISSQIVELGLENDDLQSNEFDMEIPDATEFFDLPENHALPGTLSQADIQKVEGARAEKFETSRVTVPDTESTSSHSNPELELSWDNYERMSAKHDGKAKRFWSELHREGVKSLKRKRKMAKQSKLKKANSEPTAYAPKLQHDNRMNLKQARQFRTIGSARMDCPNVESELKDEHQPNICFTANSKDALNFKPESSNIFPELELLIREHSLKNSGPKSAKHDGVAKSFWILQNEESLDRKLKRKRKKHSKITKKRKWKYQEATHKVGVLSDAAYKDHPPSVRGEYGWLWDGIPGFDSRALLLEEAVVNSEENMSPAVRAARKKRLLEIEVLDAEDFKTAQEAVMRVLSNDRRGGLQALNSMFSGNLCEPLTWEQKKELVELLQTAEVFICDSYSNCRESKNIDKKVMSQSLKKINMNGNPFMHNTGGSGRDRFVSAISELIATEQTFEEINFNYGALKEKHVVELAASLNNCKNLKHVYLDSNDFGDKGLLALINVLRKHRNTLVTLSIQNLPVWQNISTGVLREFVEAIEGSSSLTRLGFDLNMFRHQEFKDRVSKHLLQNFERLREARLSKKMTPTGIMVTQEKQPK